MQANSLSLQELVLCDVFSEGTAPAERLEVGRSRLSCEVVLSRTACRSTD